MKRVLFDEDMPRQLRRDLPEFEVRTVQEQGWSSLQNGALLRAASREFDVLITADKNLQYQQHIPSHDLGVVVIAVMDTRLPRLRLLIAELRAAVVAVQPGQVVVVRGL